MYKISGTMSSEKNGISWGRKGKGPVFWIFRSIRVSLGRDSAIIKMVLLSGTEGARAEPARRKGHEKKPASGGKIPEDLCPTPGPLREKPG
jgi:hypothetical protein